MEKTTNKVMPIIIIIVLAMLAVVFRFYCVRLIAVGEYTDINQEIAVRGTEYYANRKVRGLYECKYDSKYSEQSYLNYNSDGSVNYTQEYLYDFDDNGNLQSVGIYRDGVIERKEFYGGKERPVTVTYYDGSGQEVYECQCEYTYDNSGKMIQRIEVTDGGGYSCDKYKYDKKGNLIKITKSGLGNSNKRTIKYNYDKNGKRIKEREYIIMF